ncbi:MAG: organic hydroperoxide resistance protein [Paracoccus sp. (in: a-proteobacteria)]|uniref:organic hydroperoxide resistance protein n=1 Tax=Paracoccus sp. TaxID=267 RepID=UPI0026DEAE48|nr:organic hydroperoxide resistance protein [Paracoccus sp. (in: a-proteobacteria)]MDO5632090.1 organic hydroperoxide resistance protein [Paracoccus sp. (in: a-proteobacteria)]
MPTKILYQTSATSTSEGRNGHVAVDDGSFAADLAMPKELGGAGGDALNPEKLFALGYSACFNSALRNVAMREKVKLPEGTSVQVGVGIGPREDEGFGLAVSIRVALPGLDRAQAQALIEAAHRVCPYSDATRGSLKITPELA